MNQKPRTIDEQIRLLKSRGLLFPDADKARDILSQISYFRLKYYWTDLIDEATGDFADGVSFDDVMRRYSFDHSCRHVLR